MLDITGGLEIEIGLVGREHLIDHLPDLFRIADGRPLCGHDCEMCHACIQWCPREAIQFANRTEDKPRYRNPQVSVTAMMMR